MHRCKKKVSGSIIQVHHPPPTREHSFLSDRWTDTQYQYAQIRKNVIEAWEDFLWDLSYCFVNPNILEASYNVVYFLGFVQTWYWYIMGNIF